MGGFSASSSAVAGVRLIGRRPWAVAAWCLFSLVLMGGAYVACFALTGPDWMKLAAAIGAVAANSGRPGFESFEGYGEVWRSAKTCILDITPALVANMLLSRVVCAAVFRAVARPEQGAFAYLRFGPDELRLIAVRLIVQVVVLAVYGLLFGVPVYLALGLRQWNWLLMLALLPIVELAQVALWVKFAFISPLTFLRRRIDLFGSWSLTRGRFWPVAGMLLLVALICVAFTYVEMALRILASGGLDPMSPHIFTLFQSGEVAKVIVRYQWGWMAAWAVQFAAWGVMETLSAAPLIHACVALTGQDGRGATASD